MGEAIDLVENFKVEKVTLNCGEFNELEQELIKVLDKKKISYYSYIKELNIDNKLYFLNNKDYGNENDNSSVIYIELNNQKFLFMGDAGVEVAKRLQNLVGKKIMNELTFVPKDERYHFLSAEVGSEIAELYELLSVKMIEKSACYFNKLSQINDPFEKTQLYENIDYSKLYKIIDNQSKKSIN